MLQQDNLNDIMIPKKFVTLLEDLLDEEKVDEQEFDFFGVPINDGKKKKKKTRKQQIHVQIQQQQANQQPTPQTSMNQDEEPEIFDDQHAKGMRFDDDEQLISDQQQQQLQQEGYNLEENIKFYIASEQSTIRLDEEQELACIVGVKSKEIHVHEAPSQIEGDAQNQFNIDQQQTSKVGVDLFCIIDRSGSMNGQKIENVKQTLNILLNFLSPKDRLCLIQFDDTCQRLTNLRKVTDENKTYFSEIIQTIYANGGTVISLGTQMAFKQIKFRKYDNNVTSLFLLSDGQDGSAVDQISKQLKIYKKTLTIHSFGFGSDHDAKMMTKIANLGNGSFYFVNDISLLDEFFVDALGALTSVVATDLNITLQNETQHPYDGIKISKFYGKNNIDQSLSTSINIPQLAEGKRRDFVFKIKIPKIIITEDQQNVLIFNATLRMKSSQTGEKITKNTKLQLEFIRANAPHQEYQDEKDIEVTEQLFRVESAQIVQNALMDCQNNKNNRAIEQIDTLIQQAQINPKLAERTKNYLADLEQVKQAAKKEYFHKFGSNQMNQIISNNLSQQGINAKFDAAGLQLQQEDQGQYQNSKQKAWVKTVQYSKMKKAGY